jgi:Lipocalin-like domain
LAADKENLASVKPGKPPADCPVLGTWRLRTYVRERLSDGQRHNQFGEAPVGYIGYAPDGRMYAIFTRDDRVVPRDVVPTDEEGVQLLGTMVAYAGTFSLGRMSWFITSTLRGIRHGPAPIRSGTSCWREIR